MVKNYPNCFAIYVVKAIYSYDDLSDKKEKDSKKNNIQKIIMHFISKKKFYLDRSSELEI